MKKKANFPKG